MKIRNLKPFSSLKKALLSDQEVKKNYDDLAPEYDFIASIIDKRLKKRMSQTDLAKKIGSRQSAISRLESGDSNPSYKFLLKVARALDSTLRISFQ